MSGIDAPQNRPTLEGVIQRLEALEQENLELRAKVVALEGSARRKEKPVSNERPAVAEERVSRKAMLAKAGAVAVAVAAAGTMLSPREAKAAAVAGSGDPGVAGTGTEEWSTGVVGQLGSGVAVGDGVQGYGRGPDYNGVIGLNFSSGGYGVSGYGGTGVRGQGRGSGYGGQFEGGKAQLKLTPKGTTGRPTSGSHQKGEIYVDSNASLFMCTNSGTPGTWKKVTTTSA